jgi:uncharacterized protein YecT (DUF1311 family)
LSRTTYAISILSGLLCISPASGASEKSAPVQNCGDLSGQADMNVCFGNEFQRADRALNRDYDELMKRLTSNEKAQSLLRSAERAWIAFRDAHCAVEAYAVEGGSVMPTVHAECLRELTAERQKQIDQQLNCTEGELTCLAPERKH